MTWIYALCAVCLLVWAMVEIRHYRRRWRTTHRTVAPRDVPRNLGYEDFRNVDEVRPVDR